MSTSAWGNPSDRLIAMSGRESASFGAIVTFRNAAGETWSWTRAGLIYEVMHDACDAALRRDPTNLVVCISTPSSVYADLVGRPGGKGTGLAQRAEPSMLARAGLQHMIHPELRGSTPPRTKSWRDS